MEQSALENRLTYSTAEPNFTEKTPMKASQGLAELNIAR